MRASFYRRDSVFETGPAPVPTAGPGEALLRVRRVGICGTDLHIYQGHLDHRVPHDGIIGHEVFAEVVTAPARAASAQAIASPSCRCWSAARAGRAAWVPGTSATSSR